MDSGTTLRVLIVDDHDLFRTGLRALLEEEGFDVADSTGGAAGIRRARAFAPDVVVMDMNMPGMSGVEATRLMRETSPAASILMLTMATDEAEVLDAVRAGASGYLLKDAELSDIVTAIHAAAAGHSTIAARVARHLLLSVRINDVVSSTVTSSKIHDLSAREREVLTLVADGCDNAEIAGRLYVSSSTVKNHVSRLLEKLGVDNRVQAATFAIRDGLSGPDVAFSGTGKPPAAGRTARAAQRADRAGR
jgi:DNA-binding NarL/FixJ family response regulator